MAIKLNTSYLLIIMLFGLEAYCQPGIGISYKISQPLVPNLQFTPPTPVFTSADERVSVVAHLGGIIYFGGMPYDGIAVSSNGWLALIPITAPFGDTASGLNAAPSGDLAAAATAIGANYPVIAPLWDNLISSVGYNSQIVPGFGVGISWVIRWSDVTWATQANNNFDVIINQATNQICFVYETGIENAAPASASIGITGPCNGDYYSWASNASNLLTTIASSQSAGSTFSFTTVPAAVVPGQYLLPSTFTSTSIPQTVSTVLTCFFLPNIVVGMYVSGLFVAANTTVIAVTPSTVTLSTGTSSMLPIGTRIAFSYFPQGTTVTSIAGSSVTFSNSTGVAVAAGKSIRLVGTIIDSVAVYDSVGASTAFPRPGAYHIDWTPGTPWNDSCSGAGLGGASWTGGVGSWTASLGTIGANCTPLTWAITPATASAPAWSCGAGINDVWFTVTKPVGIADFIVRTAAASCNAVSGTSVEVFQGTCSSLGVMVGCSTDNISHTSTFGEIVVNGNNCVSQNYLVRVSADGSSRGKFTICAVQTSTGSLCSNAVIINTLPYSRSCLTTCGSGNDYNSTMSCISSYMNGEDYVFMYTPTITGCVSITISNTSSNNPGVFVVSNCANSGGACLGSATGTGPTITIPSVSLQALQTYFIIVDNLGSCTPFNIDVSSISASAVNDEICGSIDLTSSIMTNSVCNYSIPYSTFCSSTSTGIPAPGCTSIDTAGDVWFKAALPAGGILIIDTKAGTMLNAAMAVYNGPGFCSGSLNLLACDMNSSSNANYPRITISGTAGDTIYIRIFAENNTSPGTFQLCLSTCGAPPNADPCGAAPVTTSAAAPCTWTGNFTTSCAKNTVAGSPPNPTCGNYNGGDVWFQTTVPSTGIISIDSRPGTGTNPMGDAAIALYTAPSCSGPFTQVGCASGGSSSNPLYPFLSLGSLTTGTTVYIRVWSEYDATPGTFQLCLTKGSCPLTGSITLNIIHNISCSNYNDGAVYASVTGGMAPFSYLWSTGSTNDTISNLTQGIYQVTATDVNGCTNTGSITLTQPSMLTSTCSVLSNLSCTGASDGLIFVSATGGTSPYFGGIGLHSGLVVGTYTYTVTDYNGCTTTCSATVIDPASVNQNCLIAFYPFSGNAIDSSFNGNNGTVHNASLTADRFGNANKAYLFNGTSSYLNVPDNPPLRLSNSDYTINVWVYETARNSSFGDAIISKRLNAIGPSGYMLYVSGNQELDPGKITFLLSGGADPHFYSHSVLNLNQWYMVTVKYQKAIQNLKIYINGSLNLDTSGVLSPTNVNPNLIIGTDAAGSPYFFHGKIDDIRIFNCALSDNQISTLYSAGCVLPVASISTCGSTTLCAGSSVTLSANTGTGYSYQWKRNGINISGATLSSYTALNDSNYTCTVTNSCGGSTSTSIFISVNICAQLRVFIEGFYIGSGYMRAVTDPFNYPDRCDVVYLELHSTLPPYNAISFINSNGLPISTFNDLISTTGYGLFRLPLAANGQSCYLVIHTRNAIETWSASPVTITANTLYDFTNAQNKAYGSNLFDLGDGNFAIWSGDVNQDGIVESTDYSELENAVYLVSGGYIVPDLTGDGIVESEDYSLMEDNVFKVVGCAKP